MTNKIGLIKQHGPAVLIALCIFVLSSIPALEAPDLGIDWQDKWIHGLVYCFFGLALQRSFSIASGSGKNRWMFSILTGILYGFSDEIHQSFVPGRDASIGDFLADAVGILLSHGFRYLWIKRQT